MRLPKSDRLATPFVFTSSLNVRQPIGSVKRAHRAAAKRANIKVRFRLYDLRHTFATRAAAAEISLPRRAAILGHASIQMTVRYVHPAAEEKRKGMEKFERFRTQGVISAAAAQQSHGVPTIVSGLGELMRASCKSSKNMARPEGFEPPTLWFEARCSIQLSYGRAATFYREVFSGESVIFLCPYR
jgi:Phage integrase family